MNGDPYEISLLDIERKINKRENELKYVDSVSIALLDDLLSEEDYKIYLLPEGDNIDIWQDYIQEIVKECNKFWRNRIKFYKKIIEEEMKNEKEN